MKTITNVLKSFTRIPKPFLFIASFATLGVILLLISRAATPYASLEIGTGSNVTPPATIVTGDSSASGGSYVKFGGGSTGTRQCAGEFPDGSCTGVPTGTSLTVHNGELRITQANAVIDAKDIRGCVYVEADNVTIKRSKISNCFGQHTTVIKSNGRTTLVEDVEIDGGAGSTNYDLAGVGGSNLTCRRCNIHRLTKGAHFDASNYVFEYSWVHDLYMPGGPSDNAHGEAIYTDFTNNGIIRGNNLDSNNTAGTSNNSGSLAVYNLYGGHNNLLIENNLFNTNIAAICMYVGYTHNANFDLTNVRVLNNRFGRKYYPNCGEWQPAWAAGNYKSMNWGGITGNVWSGNAFTDGAVVAAP